ncbi:MAG: hypothetical protein EZS28_007722 [Streblomastix strix]|uniref:Uncharacterized protein n=1 Tax=Streblomastix strix TaxID=222440 RepID=A0A5J4WP55_9EUKA|nr:MAG: hypothetical protein EZS28_007722 [Streblomastix strix]
MTELQSESIPLLVNSIISEEPYLRTHSTERLVSIALQEEQSGNTSGELYLFALVTLLKIDENAPQHVHTNTLSIIIELLSNGVNPNELAGLIPILTKLGSEKDEKKKKITTKAKMIEAQLAILKKIGDDFKIPLEGTEDEKKNILEVQENDAQLIINTYEDNEDDDGRRSVIQSRVVEGFLHIFEKQELSTISNTISTAFLSMTIPASDEIIHLIFANNPYPGLLRLLDHTNSEIVFDAIASINNILTDGFNSKTQTLPHPHFELMNEIKGIEKIYALFRRNISQNTICSAALCIGFLFRAKEIEDADMRREIVAHLKLLINDEELYIKTNSKAALRGLALNEVNRTEIESDYFVKPE